MLHNKYERFLLPAGLEKIALGYTTLTFFSSLELLPGQTGYSVGSDGRSLAGRNDGDWREGWLVIGYEDCCGDPLFVDSYSADSPVYTAAHGMGEWKAHQIADSYEAFVKSLKIISDIAIGRDNPVRLAENPIDPAEGKNALDGIKQLNPNSDIEFWELLLDPS